MNGNGSSKTESQDKREALEEFVTIGMAMLHLDARVPGVRVPPFLQNNFQLRLNVSPRFRPFDLVVDDWGVRQTLSFSGRPFPVSIPWVAIYGLSNVRGEMRLYPHSIPHEVFEALAISQGKTPSELEKELGGSLRNDGNSPAPVFVFRPADLIGASGKKASGEAEKSPVPSAPLSPPGPRPVMMRRKGGLSLVAPPAEEKPAEEGKDAEKEEALQAPPAAPTSDADSPSPAKKKRTSKKKTETSKTSASDSASESSGRKSSARKKKSDSAPSADGENGVKPRPPVFLRVIK